MCLVVHNNLLLLCPEGKASTSSRWPLVPLQASDRQDVLPQKEGAADEDRLCQAIDEQAPTIDCKVFFFT